MISVEEARRLALDDAGVGDGGPPRLVVIGCGSLLRGDDAVGPILIRHLWHGEGRDAAPGGDGHDHGDAGQGRVPDDVVLVDGGTAGMDVAFKMKGARRVILVDAATTGSEPGTVFRVPGEELEELPPLDGLHTHQFRWDHALSFGRWLLADQYPDDITVYLIEIAQTTPGADLSAPVEAAMHQVAELIRAEWAGPAPVEPAADELVSDEPVSDELVADGLVSVEITDDGYVRLSAELAARWFPGDSLVAARRGAELWLLPLIGHQAGGLLLKQRNARGDRSALVWEALAGDDPSGAPPPSGIRPARWDAGNGALRVDLRS